MARGCWAALLGVVLGFVLIVGAVLTVPRLLGWQPVTVVSGSMAPAVRAGDVLLVAPLGARPARVGEVVTYRRPGTGALVTHRITTVDDEGRAYRTRGDANLVDDAGPVPAGAVLGRARVRVPLAGLPVLHPAATGIVLLGGTVLVAGCVLRRRRLRRDRLGQNRLRQDRLRRDRLRRHRPVMLVAGLCLGCLGLTAVLPASAAQFTSATDTGFSFGTGDWQAFPQQVRDLGPVSYWPLDETSGTTVADAVGGNPMTYVGSPTVGLTGALYGSPGHALGLNTNAQGAQTAASPATLNLRGPISVMAWVKMPAGGSTASSRIVAKYAYAGSGGVSYMLALSADQTSMRLLFDLTAGSPSRPVAYAPIPSDHAWHLYVGTWDGSTVRVYRDGVLGGSTPVTGAGQLVSTTARVTVGAPGFSESAVGTTVDEAAVWDRALSATEISALYRAGTS
ncbi:signal peptidase I [Kineosporia sp. J2-2]|uniref:Signal peptidase I n=1 Tax=Kineosporia corallincola TaxID=2835133 RepID=A0ABS5TMZ3_9ACTN|nr:signal peptidase I [Kineosporia corallincola]MBT0770964.1 signal peptidase I [Kineosporia corallincola]